MHTKKIRVGILFGGKSAEHEVSLESAKNVVAAIDKEMFDVVEIKIAKDGIFDIDVLKNTDVIFPVLHGTYGEDGTMQGFLEILDIPYVGAGVLGSAVGMDKEIAKRLLRDADIPIAKFSVFHQGDAIKNNFGWPVFVKPSRAGSSVGVHKVNNEKELQEAASDALRYDSKILIEEAIVGHEIECSVLGNDDPIASLPGKIIPNHEFYSYEAKYIDPEGAQMEIPAKLSDDIIKNVQKFAVLTYKTLCLEGMARVDMFLKDNGDVYINEVNTIPGFTKISMYPKLWEASGLSYKELVTRLINLALDRHAKKKALKTSYEI